MDMRGEDNENDENMKVWIDVVEIVATHLS